MTENQALPTVKISLGGSEYELTFTLYSFAKLKKVKGINALKGEVDFSNPDHLLSFLWAGLIVNHEEFDGELIDGRPDKALSAALRKLGKHLTLNKIAEVGQAIRQAFESATKVPGEDSAPSDSSKKE